MRPTRLLTLLLVTSVPAVASAQSATTPREVTTPHPTLEHISIEWAIDGDDDEDGVVTVRYREEGASSWRTGLPLRRVPAGSNEGYSWDNRHAGSLFSLSPDTAYEIELALADPDGGSDTRTVTARTRPVPTVPDDARIVEATPSTVDSILGGAEPGDVILLGAGTYGSLHINRDGEAGRPIVVRGSDVEEVIVEGEIRMDGHAHVWLEDLSVRGQIKFNNASNIVVRRCHIETVGFQGHGIISLANGSTDGYIADNVITGLTEWTEASLGVDGDNIGEGIWMTGPGNVIEHNRLVGFRDCISLLEGDSASNQISIDILRNDLENCSDDGIEADFSLGNVRVIQNRLTNTFIGLSSQPSLGGPTYFIRNVSFNNLFQVFKPQRGSVGDVWFHNTVVKPGDALAVNTSVVWSRALFRNNLIIGGTVERSTYNGYNAGSGRVLQVSTLDTASSDFDYDGYGSIGTDTFRGNFGGTTFDSLAALRSMTTEAHAVEVDLSVFAATFAFPEAPFPGHEAPDLRLTEGAAVDAGEVLPNINDGYGGGAPDLGAYELGGPLPQYGPRTGEPECGNGVLEVGEACDDSNTSAGDGCDASCRAESDADAGTGGEDAGTAPGTDGGASGHDAGNTTTSDGGAPPATVTGSCGCRAVGTRSSAGALAALLLLGLVAARRSRR